MSKARSHCTLLLTLTLFALPTLELEGVGLDNNCSLDKYTWASDIKIGLTPTGNQRLLFTDAESFDGYIQHLSRGSMDRLPAAGMSWVSSRCKELTKSVRLRLGLSLNESWMGRPN